MKKYTTVMRLFSLITASLIFGEFVNAQFVYLNPMPGSMYHNPQTTIAIKNGDFINEASVRNRDWVEIIGSKSGAHAWMARLSDDGKTIVVKPHLVFEYGETITVVIQSKLKKTSGQKIQGTTFSFQIAEELTAEQQALKKQAEAMTHAGEFEFDSAPQSDTRGNDLDSLPTFSLTVNNNPAPGQIFYNNQYDFDPDNTNCFNTIIENSGSVVYSKDMGINGHDFRINYDGNLTYTDYTNNQWIVMDSNYKKIDSIAPGNGYTVLNPHDISRYSDRHSLILIDDYRPVDMTPYGGQPNALVNMGVIEEIDANHDVVWEWSGADHFQLTDADNHVVLTSAVVDLIHFNAVSRDNDGNVLLSSRFLSEVTKINHSTGAFIWRLGGENNQFTFVNDNISQHFTYQHDARRITNGNITLYNNANYMQPPRSSAKEYHLDEANHTATLVWYYEHPDVNGYIVNGPATGSVQRLPNGNTIISWGTNSIHSERPAFTEVDSNKNITWELHFDEYGQKSYRVHKYVWNPCAPVNPANIKVKKITSTSAKVTWSAVHNATSYDLQYRKVGNATWKLKNATGVSKKIMNLTANKSYEFHLKAYCANGYVSDWSPLDTFKTLPAKLLSDENDNIPEFEIYPNPVNDVLTIGVTSETDEQVTVYIYSITGRVMLEQKQSLVAGEQELKINISDFPSGYYLAQVAAGSAKETMKFVKE